MQSTIAGEESMMTRILNVLDQAVNGTHLDDIPNHSDDSLQEIADSLPEWPKKRLLAHAKRLSDLREHLLKEPVQQRLKVEALPGDTGFVSIDGHIHKIEGYVARPTQQMLVDLWKQVHETEAPSAIRIGAGSEE
jgi:hypothetical protein